MTDAAVLWLEDVDSSEISRVGGKNASLGELIGHLGTAGVRVPGGFATTADAYRSYIEANELRDPIAEQIARLDGSDRLLGDVGHRIRSAIAGGAFPAALAREVEASYRELCRRHGTVDLPVAVRSSATAEDLPEASFAGQQESFLNVVGVDALLDACRQCFASLFTDRAISYRQEHGFDHLSIALSVGVQPMIGTDHSGAGVMFSIDADTGFPGMVVINASWGLGESIVKGSVDPDEYRVFKAGLGDPRLSPILSKTLGTKEHMIVSGSEAPTRTVPTSRADRERWVLSDSEIVHLARWAAAIEEHYGRPMDIEWAKDDSSGDLYCLQARPETVHSRRRTEVLTSFRLRERGPILTSGSAIGEAIAQGQARLLHDPDEHEAFHDGDVLVTERTNPDWGPLMRRASAIVTDHGGRTSHAAIVSRELGVPAVIGAGDATTRVPNGRSITVSCAEGSRGFVYDGLLDIERHDVDIAELPVSPVPLMLNLANPEAALRWWRLPVAGIGLVRMEFIIANAIRVHPLALTRFDRIDDADVRERIIDMTAGFDSREEYFVERLARGIATIAASQHPRPVVVRLSDFKTNEYAALLGGGQFEPEEENPMLGFRGASRYYSDDYRDGFALECRAIRMARDRIGLDNIAVMVPFVRTPREAERVIGELAVNGIQRGRDGLRILMMCEIPSNVLLIRRFAPLFDGISIGSNDLTQLILGIDRDCERLGDLFDERNEAVVGAITDVIRGAHEFGIEVGICGQAPSDDPAFARMLVERGIDSLSLNPDSVAGVLTELARSAVQPV